MKHILFVCSANKDRSKTAEDHFSERFPAWEFLSAGTNRTACEKYGTSFISQEIIDWADQAFVMEEKHLQFIKSNFHSSRMKITVLKIEDIYPYGDKKLIQILEQKLLPVFKKKAG
jgi:predicted protein tyrosine phosphatase